jgi:hypothetical protein
MLTFNVCKVMGIIFKLKITYFNIYIVYFVKKYKNLKSFVKKLTQLKKYINI